MTKLDKNGNFKDIVAELRSVAMIETGLLYSRRLMLNQAADEIERLREFAMGKATIATKAAEERAVAAESHLADARADALGKGAGE